MALAVQVSWPGSVTAWLLAWGLPGSLSACFAMATRAVRPRLSGCLTWCRQQRDLVPRYALEYISILGTSQLVLYVVGGLEGPSRGGGRATCRPRLCLGLSNILFNTLRLTALPLMARRSYRQESIMRLVRLLSAAALAATGCYFAVREPAAGRRGSASSWGYLA